ncbi:MAG: hypothetical protein HY726_16015 [Candidatus Rokubacteria bacterium]|nr:hypothetical protein [Candidatus Rokubacteria bacterium]
MSLQGWVPEPGDSLTLAEVIDLAFDYRGNTTIVRVDGTEVEGYIFNRDRDVPEPFIQMFDLAGNGPFTIRYSEIRNVKFTGRDMAADNSWTAWLEAKGKGAADGRHGKEPE